MKAMKKLVLAAVGLSVCMTLAGCGKKPEPEPAVEKVEETEVEKMCIRDSYRTVEG